MYKPAANALVVAIPSPKPRPKPNFKRKFSFCRSWLACANTISLVVVAIVVNAVVLVVAFGL